ncbi:MAG: 4Fe-4S dicluster domain-containing protein, partial [Planctomycetes bacterium]|nr:4Fe-4S dicluster domain-containing protein [Planctomycetota bacterium]
MGLFTVDQGKCKGDGICVAECPMGVIEIQHSDNFPSVTENGEGLCINCGHCVAVCPHGAFSLTTMKPEDCSLVMKETLPSAVQVEHFLKSRRSARVYKEKRVSIEILTKVIEIAAYSPSGHNDQPVHW